MKIPELTMKKEISWFLYQMGAIETEGRIEFCFCQNYSHFFSKTETQKKDVHNLIFFSIIIRLLFF